MSKNNSQFTTQKDLQSSSQHTILFVLPSLAGGGAERAVATLLTHLDPTAVTPHLCLYKKEGIFCREVEAAGVPIHEINVNGRSDPRLIPRLRHLIRQLQPNMTIGVMRSCGIMAAIAHRLAAVPGTVWINEQNHPSAEMAQFGKAKIKTAVYRPILKSVNGIIAISNGIADDLTQNFGVPASKIVTIPNPIDIPTLQQKAQHPINHRWFGGSYRPLVSVGRLHPQKGHDVLIEAFKQVHTAVPQSRLLIIGRGAEEENLTRQIKRLSLEESVELAGFQANPYPAITHAELFVLASRYEGFGIVLAEALALQTAVVATDCPSGPAEILAGGKAGLLVPPNDAAALANHLLTLLNEPAKQAHFVKTGYDQVQQYAATAVAAQYTKLFKKVIG